MKKLILIVLAMLLCGCADQRVNTGRYQNETESFQDIVSLDLQENQTFYLSPSMLSSWLGAGRYEISGNQLKLTTDAEDYVYVFTIIDEKTLKYDAEKSSSHRGSWDLEDGVVLCLIEAADE